ncbi:putative Zinc protease pqqL [Arcticibacter svalbardensis MN12-7]|uniref:Putative Zinc protease pqqL n=1 Tax=Arcticibacter svalbardensis MN12-7 TaxID=1150600 RepID=R9GX16_9SPHI|nr:putative Zinc protease pqqL [Arcticibacter svalbardensis MN12-7]
MVAQEIKPSTQSLQLKITPDQAELLPLDPAVKTGTLENGFRYFIRKNIEPQKRATFYLAMKAGSILENEEELGLAHFLEHMAFNGTKNYPKNELINYLQTNGVRFGADLNAYTSFDETVYQLPIPTDNPEIVKNGIQILRDWSQNILLATEEINKERGVIMEEKRLGKGAGERMQSKYLPVLFNHSRYAERLPIGKENILLSFKPETIRQFYSKWYRPDLQALIVVGDIDVEEIEKLIIAKFSDLKNPKDAPERKEYSIPLNGSNQFISVTDKENTSTVIQVLMKHDAPDFKTTIDFRESLKKVLFNNLMSSRISEIRKQADPPFLQGGSSIGDFMAGLEVASVVASVKPGQLERGFKAVWTETERIKKFGFTQTELDRMKNTVLVYQESSFKEREKTHSNNYVNEYLALFLKGNASPGKEYEYNFYKNVLPGIMLEEVNALANKYFTESNRDILVMAPESQKDSLPDEQTVLTWIKEVTSTKILAYDDAVSDKPLMANEPIPGKVTSVKEIKSLGIKELTLSNGIKVVLKPTNFKNDEILFGSFSPGGNSLYSDAKYQSAVNAVPIIASSGLGQFNSKELPKVLSGKMVSISPYISERYEGINGSASHADLETAMKLVNLFFTEPRVDRNIFDGLITNYKSSLINRSNSPSSVFSDTVSAILGSYHVRRTGPSIEKANQISMPEAMDIYKDRFADASDFIFFFVGSFKVDSIQPFLEKYLGSLPSINRHEQWQDLGIRIPKGRFKKVVKKGSEDKATVQLVFSGDYKYREKENVHMDALEEILKIRLTERLREDEGGVYTPSASVSYSKNPSKYTISISFGCAPDNVDKLIAATLDEIEKLQKNGAKKEDLIKVVSESKRTRETRSKTNGFWLGYLSAQYQLHEDLDELFSYEKLLENISSGDIKKTSISYLSMKNFIQFILLPE